MVLDVSNHREPVLLVPFQQKANFQCFQPRFWLDSISMHLSYLV